jgi:chorismate synthase
MNSFGNNYKVTIVGESHGKGAGVVIDGCPAGISLTDFDFIKDLGRRKSGAKGTTPRKEDDEPKILTGVFDGKTTGAPITIWFDNKNTKSQDYSEVKHIYRPGHADFVASKKYGGFQDFRGGGHFSGRITLGLVSAGVIAKKILKNAEIEAKLISVGGYKNIEEGIDYAIKEKDSIGGLIECKIKNLPVGLGEPFFDSVESAISHLVFSIPGIKGIEFGSGFKAAEMLGSEHNDNFLSTDGKTETNNAAGINGGITNGNEIVFRVAVKPTSSIFKIQKTMDFKKEEIVDFELKGRHDVCIALRIPVIVESAAAIALADLGIQQQEYQRVVNK